MNRLDLLFSPALLLAVSAAATSDPAPCPACLEPDAAGLCHSERCRAQVLPVARPSALAKDTHSGKYFELGKPVELRATEHATRMANQSARATQRLGRAMGGAFTVSRHKRAHR